MSNKKNAVVTAQKLREKSDVAIGAFKGIITSLRAANDAAAEARSSNENQIAKLQEENKAIEELSAQNEKIVKNIENLLTV